MGGRASFGPTMQPATVTVATASAARLRQPDRGSDVRGIALTTGLSRCDRSYDLPLLQRHGRLLHDRFSAVKSGLNLDRIAEIPAEHDRLKVECVSTPDSHDPRPAGIEAAAGARYHRPSSPAAP